MAKSKANTGSNTGQVMISSYFSQSPKASPAKTHHRSSTPIDLTLESDEDERPAKKKRKMNSFFTINAANTSSSSTVQSSRHVENENAVEQYRFDPDNASIASIQTSSQKAARRQRLERAKRILLYNDSVLAQHEQDEQGMPEDGEGDEPDDESVVDEPEDEVDANFRAAMALFQASSSSKSKRSKRKNATVTEPPAKRKKATEIGPSGEAYTALELQVRELKKDNPGTLLMFEVGYKIIFYGEDAQTAAKLLGVVCSPHHNFLTAMIPVHRKEVHLKKFLSHGLKVGIVEQTETAALKKASDNRNRVFNRQLTQLYTAATYIDQLHSVDDTDPTAVPPLVCLIEELWGGMGADERVCISMISICASTGDVIWDQFEDNHMRTELETRLVHITPSELLLSEDGLSKSTEKMLNHFTSHSHTDYKTRTEKFPKTMSYTNAFSYLTKFYTDKTKTAIASDSVKSGQLLASMAGFPNQVVIALAHVVKYLSTFDVADALLETKFFMKFTERTHMLLNGNTLTNLEIYRNETDYTKKGSLMWILDRTTTRFGARMLKDWIGRPLIDKTALKARIDAVEEIMSTYSAKLTVLRNVLKGLPDLARGLCRIQYGKCTPQELAILLPAFNKVATCFNPVDTPDQAGFQSPILNEILYTMPKLRGPIKDALDAISLTVAKEGKKESMWINEDKFPEIEGIKVSIQVVESELVDELRKIRRYLKRPALQYSTVAGEEYVLELKKSELKEVPARWTVVSATKYMRRLRSPEIIEKLQQRAQWKEALDAEANRAYRSFLEEISQHHYGLLRDAVNKLASADCLLSLAILASQQDFVRPQFSDDDVLEIVAGRHPMVEALRDSPFVPNTVQLDPRHQVITGPNMGGKSSVVRMIALCIIMAQIGSYVPAESMKLAMVDGILVRMGASDELARGRSTFMVELQETSDILHLATAKTLVILDELGRGTSTFDGMAIAGAVLQHLVQQTRCKTLFITHYPDVAEDLERKFPMEVQNMHMAYTEDLRIDGTRDVTFLYKLTSGITTNSFGVECARLAGIPESVLRIAAHQAETMRALIAERSRKNRLRKALHLAQNTMKLPPSDALARSLDELHMLVSSMSV